MDSGLRAPMGRRQLLFGAAAAGALASIGDFVPRIGPLARTPHPSVVLAQSTEAAWEISGDYVESCSCDYVCPCTTSNGAGAPSKGSCTLIQGYHIGLGRYGTTQLDGLNFVLAVWYPGRPTDGNGQTGVIIDQRADPAQQEALTAIASGQAGGPAARVVALSNTFLGAEVRPITIDRNGLGWTISVPDLVEAAIDGVPGAIASEPLYIDNTGRGRLGLARSSTSHLAAFGIQWDDDSGLNNGFLAPFKWQG